MKTKLVLDVQNSADDLIAEYLRKLEVSHRLHSVEYNICMESFETQLKKLLNEAFALGLSTGLSQYSQQC